MKLMIVDDIEVYRRALCVRLASEYDPIIHCGVGEEAICMADQQQPDIVICDFDLPGSEVNQFALLAALRDRLPQGKIICDTVKQDVYWLLRILDYQVDAICDKQWPTLQSALAAVKRNKRFFPAAYAVAALTAMQERASMEARLSPREQVYFRSITPELNQQKKLFAQKIAMTVPSLRNLEVRLRQKLNCYNQHELMTLSKRFYPDQRN